MFIAMSRNKALRSFSESSSLGAKLSSRFVAGMTVEDALQAAARVNAEGIAVTLDSLGESVLDPAQAQAGADIYHELLDAIEARGLNANVSVKLSQVGMDLDPSLAESIVAGMVERQSSLPGNPQLPMPEPLRNSSQCGRNPRAPACQTKSMLRETR